ncbi:6017_t:CDS:10 [Ambispora leptoticha]|uniref:6017_t:CDS:1 n=1 Tax=Ambispora leptoticha TaxID=144679 RepID=A0A9N8ZL52_9GLOM|nr:6017_t:CDS:10 [Ambispora leptoticha]
MSERRVSFDEKESTIIASPTNTVGDVPYKRKRIMPKRRATPYVWSNYNDNTTTEDMNEGKGEKGNKGGNEVDDMNANTTTTSNNPIPLSDVSDYDNMVLVFQNQTYCDWRVTINCENGGIYAIIYQVTLIWLLLLIFACGGLLYYRLRVLKCQVIAPKIPGAGSIRPNPIEAFLVWELVWLIGRALFIFVIRMNLFPNSYLIREFLQAFPELFGAAGFAWFAVGTYLQIGVHLNSKTRPWRPDYRMADRFLLIITIAAPLTTWPLVILDGYIRDNGDPKIADAILGACYVLSSFWYSFGAMGAFYFGRELCNVLRYRIEVARENSNSTGTTKLETGLQKIRKMLYITFTTYIYYITFCIIFASTRVVILTRIPEFNQFLFITYCLLMPCCICIVVGIASTRNKQAEQAFSKDITSVSGSGFEDDQETITSKTQLQCLRSKFRFGSISSKSSSRALDSILEVNRKTSKVLTNDGGNLYSPPSSAKTLVDLEMDEVGGKQSNSLTKKESWYSTSGSINFEEEKIKKENHICEIDSEKEENQNMVTSAFELETPISQWRHDEEVVIGLSSPQEAYLG